MGVKGFKIFVMDSDNALTKPLTSVLTSNQESVIKNNWGFFFFCFNVDKDLEVLLIFYV